ncbi:hypothetical protein GPL17_16685 [Bradyrhizobium yuanmingense]|uniref:hypothetical protein n=1 Tax=Bradyrhizobium yuanmingense TaxID=108015 RepID=UPI0012FA483D|nr:hypothetical protein [Bradyrhizobium yuanmingense]MVT52121.1 hypothetical protein [Bradyrhizobium yuanmingense]
MLSISWAGSTRSPVVVIGPLAIKFAKGRRGRVCNLYEADLYRKSGEARRELLCPALWVFPFGLLLIQAAAVPLTDMMPIEEYLEMDSRWRNAELDNKPSPFEPKACDWGWFKGRRVALDYSLPAWEDEV